MRPEGAHATTNLQLQARTKKEPVDIAERLRNPTGIARTGTSATGRTGESTLMPVNRLVPEGAMAHAPGTPSGTGPDDGRESGCARWVRPAVGHKSQ
jgi:hypothetical protein